MACIKQRRSIRKFKPDLIPCEDMDAIIEAGLYAASGMGKQATKIIAVTNKKVRDELSDLNRQIGGWKPGFDPFYGAPVVLIVLGDKSWVNHGQPDAGCPGPGHWQLLDSPGQGRI